MGTRQRSTEEVVWDQPKLRMERRTEHRLLTRICARAAPERHASNARAMPEGRAPQRLPGRLAPTPAPELGLWAAHNNPLVTFGLEQKTAPLPELARRPRAHRVVEDIKGSVLAQDSDNPSSPPSVSAGPLGKGRGRGVIICA